MMQRLAMQGPTHCCMLRQPVSQGGTHDVLERRGSALPVSKQPATEINQHVRQRADMLANGVLKATCMRMDGAASLTPGTPRLLKGMTVPGCDLQAVLVLHLVQLGLRGLQSPASIAPTEIVSGCVVQAVVLLHLIQLGPGYPQSQTGSSGILSGIIVPLLRGSMHSHQAFLPVHLVPQDTVLFKDMEPHLYRDPPAVPPQDQPHRQCTPAAARTAGRSPPWQQPAAPLLTCVPPWPPAGHVSVL